MTKTATPSPSGDIEQLADFEVEPEPGATDSAPGEPTGAPGRPGGNADEGLTGEPADESSSAPGPTGEPADGGDRAEILVKSPFTDPEGRPIMVLSRADFHTAFVKAHKVAGGLTGLQTFRVAGESDEGRDACDAIYDTAYETRWLLWMIKPGLKWLERAVAVSLYGIALKNGVAAEIAAREAAAASAQASEASP